MRSLVLVGLLVACGPGITDKDRHHTLETEQESVRQEPRAGIPPLGDETELRAQLGNQSQVLDGGIWFADATCRTRFGRPRTIESSEFDSFAKCLAGLHLRASNRRSAHDDTSVVTYEPGFEGEARVIGGKLDFIGFSGRGEGVPDTPTITPEALEALRLEGDPKAAIIPTSTEFHSHLRVCLGADGATSSISLAQRGSAENARALGTALAAWRFRPFVAGDVPMPVCANVPVGYPTSAKVPDTIPLPPTLAKSGKIQYDVAPQSIERLRVSGRITIVPDDLDKIRLTRAHIDRLVGVYRMCLDETGHYESGVMVKSSGVAGYDAKIAKTMMSTWVYQPYVVDGVAVPVCTVIRFIYTQR